MYKVIRGFSQDIINDLINEVDTKELVDAPIKGLRNSVNKSIRSSKLFTLNTLEWPDLEYEICDIVKAADPLVDRRLLFIEQCNYVVYSKGDFLSKHRDKNINLNEALLRNQPASRFYSASTLLYKSPDLEGGEFVIWDDNDKEHIVPFEIGETVVFSSIRHHQVLPVNKGKRIVLINWLGRKDLKLSK